MTSNALMLVTPVVAGIVVVATGMFAVMRINRHGRVFNWPPQPAKVDPPAVARPEK